MKKIYFLASLSFIFLLSGCNNENSESITPSMSKQESDTPHASSDTAIYLPGGGGIDFGVKPNFEKSNVTSSGSKSKTIGVKVPGNISEVSVQVGDVLVEQGYVGTPSTHSTLTNYVSYRKKEAFFTIGYTSSAKEGSPAETGVLIWYPN